MHVLALDCASRTGWAVYADGRQSSGTIDFAARHAKADTVMRHAGIFDRASSWLSDQIDLFRPSVVVLEDSAGRSLQGEAGRVLLGLRAVVLVVCRRREILVDPVSNSAWKAWMRRTHGWTAADKSDRSDAENLLAYWLSERRPLVRAA